MQVRNVRELSWSPGGPSHARELGSGAMLWFVSQAAELETTDQDLLFVLSGRGRLHLGQTSTAIAQGMAAWLPECSAALVQAATDDPLIILRITSPSPAEATPAPGLPLGTPEPTKDPVREPDPHAVDTLDAFAAQGPQAAEEPELLSGGSERPAHRSPDMLLPPPPWAPPSKSAAEGPMTAEIPVPPTRSPDQSAAGLARHILLGPVSSRIRRSVAREGTR